MNGTENKSARSRWRDFVNRREPSALRVLGLLMLLALGLAVRKALSGDLLPAIILLIWAPALAACTFWPVKPPERAIERPVGGRGFVWVWLMVLLFAIASVVTPGSTAAATFPLMLILYLISTESLWTLPSAPAYAEARWVVPERARRWVWFVAGAATILAMWPRSTRLNDSLTTAEFSRLHDGVWGGAEVKPGGTVEFRPVNWRQARFGFAAGEDGLWSQVEGRIGLLLSGDGWDAALPLNERGLRTMPWLSGLLTVGLITILAAAMGDPRAGLAAGLILAMHPQHIRWSGETGGIPTMLMCFSVAILCVINALHTNRWRWWLGLAAAEILGLLCHSDAAFGLLALNVMAAVMLLKSDASQRDRGSHFRRLGIAGMLVMFPVVEVLCHRSPTGSMSAGDLCGISIGGAFGPGEVPDAWRSWSAWILLPLCAAGGLVAMGLQDWRTRLVAGTFSLAIALAWRKTGASGALPYAVLAAPLALAWAGAGLVRLFPRVPGISHAALGFALLFGMTSSPALQRGLTLPGVPFRELAATLQKSRDAHPNTMTATFGYNVRLARTYDPSVKFIDRLERLKLLIDLAYEQDRPLLVYHSLSDTTVRDWPRAIEELTTSGRFHRIREFPAFDPQNSYRLYRYQPREQIIRLNLKPEEK